MTKRDHTKLICDIGEISGLFADAGSLEAFFQKIVAMISGHMDSDVCSIYLYYEDTRELVLKATKGLNPDSVGKVKMKLGEGLTGLAVDQLRPICEQNASKNPNFKFFPGIGEEKYESFLAVPILRGNTRIGAMVIQNTKRHYFTQEDVRVFRAITSQLATVIETAKLLMTVSEQQTGTKEAAGTEPLKFIRGKVGSEGFAFCEAVVADRENRTLFSDGHILKDYTLQDFRNAVRLTEEQLEGFQKQIEERLADVASLIFMAQILMLKDKGFVDSIVDLIEEGVNPPQAIMSVVKKYAGMFHQIQNPYMREKSQDVEDIGRRLLENLTGKREDGGDYSGRIIIARELFPSDILKLSSQNAAGVILLSGGVSSHLSILARSLQIPLVIAEHEALLKIAPKTKIILDGEVGTVYVSPSDDVIKTFKDREELRKSLSTMKGSKGGETRTKDGTQVRILSNINLLGDLKAARELDSEGIGLYRTEFPFIVRTNFPSEEEQYFIYKKLVDGMPGREITFRTLDIGGDKVLSYYAFEKEENPFLGMRSIRFSLKHKDIFSQQIRAILRAGAGADVRMMFPMISSLDEFLEAKDIVVSCAKDLAGEKSAHKENIPVGVMIELPAALEIINELAEAADFFCIGTNDFIQYMLAVDRTNEKVADFYLAHHPSVLRALKKIADAAVNHGKDVSICGDMAHDEKYLPYFLGIGIRKISIEARYIPKIRAVIAGTDLKEARHETEILLKKNRITEISGLINKPGQKF